MVDAIALIKDPSRLKEIFGSSPTMIGGLKIDVLRSETPQLIWELAKHPVDVGVEKTDNRYVRPVGVTLDCILLDPEYSLTAVIGAASALGGQGMDDFDHGDWRTKRDKLLTAIGKNDPITVVTPSGIDYTDMMVTDIIPDIRLETAAGFFFQVSLEKVEFVQSQVTNLDLSNLPDSLKPKKAKEAKKKSSGKQNQGQGSAKSASDKKSSLLNDLIGKYL